MELKVHHGSGTMLVSLQNKAKNRMNETVIIATYVVIDEVLEQAEHHDHRLSEVSDAEVLTVAVVAALYFHNHQERALGMLRLGGYIRGRLSISRYNRRIHALREWLGMLLEVLGALFSAAEVYIIDSLPVPVCRRVRAGRCRKLKGRVYYGYCAAKDEKFFGWRLHLVCTTTGLPVNFSLLPASLHDLTPIHELTFSLPSGALVVADKGYNAARDEASILAHTGVRLVVQRRDNMLPNTPADDRLIRQHRRLIETVNSQLEAMGIQHLRARTNEGFLIKVHAALLALICAKFA
jgi:hypothetical protein